MAKTNRVVSQKVQKYNSKVCKLKDWKNKMSRRNKYQKSWQNQNSNIKIRKIALVTNR